MWESIIRGLSTLFGVAGLAIDLVGAVVIIVPDIGWPNPVLRLSETYRELVLEREHLEQGRDLLYTDIDEREDDADAPWAASDDGLLQAETTGFEEVLGVLAATNNEAPPADVDDVLLHRFGESVVYAKRGDEDILEADAPDFRAAIDRQIDARRRDARDPFLKGGVAILAVGFSLQILGELLPIGFQLLGP